MATNMQADRLANAAIQSGAAVELEIGIEDSDELPEVDRFVFRKWQEEWENQPTAASYRRLEPVVGRRERFRFGSRTAETMAHRLRFGKCAVNAVLHVMRKHDTGLCDRCVVPETVQHYLLECSSDLAAGVKQLCVTFKLPHTLDAVLADGAILRYICRTADRRLQAQIQEFLVGDDMDEERIGRGLGAAVGPQRGPGAEPLVGLRGRSPLRRQC
jgi:hypothetical protein